MDDSLRLLVHDFRAIEKADISLNGITVVTGINGCGKSTLSKLLYHTFRIYENLEEKVVAEAETSLQWIRRSLGIPRESSEPTIERLEKEYNTILLSVLPSNKWHSVPSDYFQRLGRFAPPKIREQLQNLEKQGVLDFMKKEIEESLERARAALRQKKLRYLSDDLESAFGESYPVPLKDFDVQILGQSLFQKETQTLNPNSQIEKVAYVDTPMTAFMDRISPFSPLHWEHLYNLLVMSPSRRSDVKNLLKIIYEDVLHGEAVQNNDLFHRFVFQSHDFKSRFELLQCATGMRSFAILQILLENGFLDETTLMIIDEPEAHLHPAWVVEYARLLVLINKTLGTRFFIASHDPKMVFGIQTISEKEGISSDVNFYLARKEEKTSRYVFDSQGMQVDQIFGSFNQALGKLREFGAK